MSGLQDWGVDRKSINDVTLLLIFVNLLLIGSIAFLLWRRQTMLSKAVFWPALFMKLGAGVCLGVVYVFYYEGAGDTILYFKDSSALADLARKDPGGYLEYLWKGGVQPTLIIDANEQPRTLFLIKLASVFNLLSDNNYWITAAYFSFISFLAAWFLVTRVERFVPAAYWPSVVGVLFFPSAVFWSSGLMKESLAMAGIFFLAGCIVSGWFGARVRWWQVILIPIAAWVVWNLKYYFLGVMAPVAIASLLVHNLYRMGLGPRWLALKILIWLMLMVAPLTMIASLHPNFHPQALMDVMVDNYRIFHEVSEPEDLIYYDDLRPDLFSLLYHAPKAIFSGVFRPMLWEASSDLQILAAVENTLLLLLSFGALLNMRTFWSSPYRLLIITVIVYAVVLAGFLALSVPNFGTLSRYKVGFLPFLVTILLVRNPFVIRMLQMMQRYSGSLA